jgi:hypothetical protein
MMVNGLSSISIIIYGLIFFVVTFGVKILDYIKKKELCTCLIKVPFTATVLAAMISTYFFFDSNIDLRIWGPFVGLLLLGNFFVGTISQKSEVYRIIGIASFILSYIYSSVMLYFKYGLPDVFMIILISSMYVFYVMTFFYYLELNFKEVWAEFVYTFFMFVLIMFAYNPLMSVTTIIAVSVYFISEVFLQIIRITDVDEYDDLEYNVTLIYLLGIILFIVPKNIF